jgi:hypothetical protein
MSAGPLPTRPCTQVRWVIDQEAAEDLAHTLGLLEDFLRQASHEAIDELAGYQLVRPLDPSRWADWLADYLGDQVAALRAATTPAATDPTPTGEPR